MTTDKAKKLKEIRAKSAAFYANKLIEDGGVAIAARISKADGADLFKELTEQHGGKAAAIRFLLEHYRKTRHD